MPRAHEPELRPGHAASRQQGNVEERDRNAAEDVFDPVMGLNDPPRRGVAHHPPCGGELMDAEIQVVDDDTHATLQ
jgi:hypothetical protein